MKQSKGWRIFRPKEKEDVEEIAEPDSRNEYLADLAARWADHRFTRPTAEGSPISREAIPF